MGRKDGQVEVKRDRLVWELLPRPSVEHACTRGTVVSGEEYQVGN